MISFNPSFVVCFQNSRTLEGDSSMGSSPNFHGFGNTRILKRSQSHRSVNTKIADQNGEIGSPPKSN